MHFPYRQFFETGVNIFLPATITLGFMTGINAIYTYDTNEYDIFNAFRNIITYTTVGIIAGLAFPLSIPLISGYTLYKHYIIANR